MNQNTLLLALYDISMSLGNSFELEKMLNEGVSMMLNRLNCSSASIYQNNVTQYELLYAQPKAVMKDTLYVSIVEELEEKFSKSSHPYIFVQKENNVYYYLFELKNFGYLVLTKPELPFEMLTVDSLAKINLKLVNTIQACNGYARLQEYRSRLSEAQKIAHLGSWMTKLSSKEHYWDDELFRMLGEEPQSFAPTYKKLLLRMTSASQNKMHKVVNNVFIDENRRHKGMIEIIRKDGSVLVAEIQIKLLFDENGWAVSLVGTLVDITKQYRLEKELRDESNLLKTIINTVPARIFWKDKALNYLGGNKLFAQDANLRNETLLIGKNDYDMPWKNEAESCRIGDKNVLENGISKIHVEEFIRDKDGSQMCISTSKVPLIDNHGETFGILGTYIDITERKENEKKLKLQRDALKHQAHHDVLTGLPNRLLFLDRLKQYIHKSHRNKSKMAVLFVDMDRFKEINDSLGHAFGDEAIKEVAKRITSQIRETDTIARFGGDEFVMVFNDMNKAIVITNMIRKVMQVMTAPIIVENHSIYVTLSIGISIYPDDAKTADDLLKNADAALYKAKNDGRNRYRFYTEDMTQKAFTRIKLESNLREAIENENFILYYQPQFNVKTNRLTGMEALLRWEHKSEGFVPPNMFIPVAEDTGLIVPLGLWVMKEGMHQIVQWYSVGLKPGRLAINISMLQLQQSNFIYLLEKLLDETMCKAEWLEIEVTESQVMKNPEKTIPILQKISQLGVTLAIDDFGTGYSSLSYLKRLPFDRLKIDRSFIEDIPNEEENVVSQAIIALAKSLNLGVIAEGVETEAQKEFLIENGCNDLQGYLYGKPMPKDEIEKMLKQQ